MMHCVAGLRFWAWQTSGLLAPSSPILAYLARLYCVQHEANWAISAVTKISDKNAAKIIKLSFKVARWGVHTKDITQACQHSSCRPTYHTCCCVTDVTSWHTSSRSVSQELPGLSLDQKECFSYETATVSSLSQLTSPRYLVLFL